MEGEDVEDGGGGGGEGSCLLLTRTKTHWLLFVWKRHMWLFFLSSFQPFHLSAFTSVFP